MRNTNLSGILWSLNLGKTTRPSESEKKQTNKQTNKQKGKRINRILDFAVPADYWIKIKESEKSDKYLDFAKKKKKKIWSMKVTVWYQLFLVHLEQSSKEW